MRIIQILVAPENNKWQGMLLGLGDDGCVYYDSDGKWEIFIEGLTDEELNVK